MNGIQLVKFEDGGFALHKILIEGRKFSAWYRESGQLANGRTKSVRKLGVKQSLAIYGRRYRG